MARDPLRTLLDSLAQRDLTLGPNDVKWAFESPQTKDSTIAYVTGYLNPETLLSKEELQL